MKDRSPDMEAFQRRIKETRAAGCDKVHGNHFVAMINEQQGERSCRQNSEVRLKRRRPEVSPEPLGRLRP